MDGPEAAGTIAFPGPPHRIRGALPHTRLAWATLLVALVGSVLVAVPVAYLAATTDGRTLARDTLLASGVGDVDPAATVVVGPCSTRGLGQGGRYRIPSSACPGVVVVGGERHAFGVELLFATTLPAPIAAGRALGGPAVLWPAVVLLDRWLLILVPTALMGFALALVVVQVRSGWRRAALRQGRIQVVDLLTWSGRPWFAYVDGRGRRRQRRASSTVAPLILDGLRGRGAALVAGDRSELIDGSFGPLDLEPGRRDALNDVVRDLQLLGRVRGQLPPLPDEAGTPLERADRLEVALRARGADHERLFELAWRLVWDADDVSVAERALRARDHIARRLGPAAADRAWADCRSKYGG